MHTRENVGLDDLYEEGDGAMRKHEKEKDQLKASNARMFERMEYFLDCEFNLLIYGVGSKREQLNDFLTNLSLPIMVVNGYHVGTTIKTVLNSVSKFINQLYKKANRPKFQSQSEQIDEIKKHMNKLEEIDMGNVYLLIVIHSLDMGALKQSDAIEILGQLATCRHIRFVITVDNCKAGVLFNDRLLD